MRTNFSLTAEQRADARTAIQLLSGSGITLSEAAKVALSGRKDAKPTTIDEAGGMFLAAKRAAGKRPKTLTWYGEMLDVFAADNGAKRLDDFTRSDLLAWIAKKPAGSRPHFLRVIRALFRWSAAQEPQLLTNDPTRGMRIEPEQKEHAIEFLTVDQCATLLRDERHRAANALALFAGIRPEEIAGEGKQWLKWGAVNEAEQIVRVPAECAKTRRTRILEGLPGALWHWLASVPQDQRGATVSRSQAQQIARRGRSALGLEKWPQDALRHTFATYAVAFTGDAAKVALWLGHEGSTTLLHRHYRGLATKAQAEAFFALRP